MTAYRQPHGERPILFCPRCNELLDQTELGVDLCLSCEGLWITAGVLELGDKQWPSGPQAWWRNELRCPECTTAGLVTVMNARACGSVIIDQCATHGVWLDRGELAVVMNDAAMLDLGVLRRHLSALTPSPEELASRRERWRMEQDMRAEVAAAERKRIERKRRDLADERARTEALAAAAKRAHETAKVEASKAKAAKASEGRSGEGGERQSGDGGERRSGEGRSGEGRARPILVEPPAKPDRSGEIARLTALRDAARERVLWISERIENLHTELATMQRSEVDATAALLKAQKNLDEAREPD